MQSLTAIARRESLIKSKPVNSYVNGNILKTLLIREQLNMSIDDKKGALPLAGRVQIEEPLWELYEKLDYYRVEASKTINPMIKARAAEKAIPITQELIRQIIIRLIDLEKKGGEL